MFSRIVNLVTLCACLQHCRAQCPRCVDFTGTYTPSYGTGKIKCVDEGGTSSNGIVTCNIHPTDAMSNTLNSQNNRLIRFDYTDGGKKLTGTWRDLAQGSGIAWSDGTFWVEKLNNQPQTTVSTSAVRTPTNAVTTTNAMATATANASETESSPLVFIILAVAGGSLAVFAILYTVWVRRSQRKLSQVSIPTVPVVHAQVVQTPVMAVVANNVEEINPDRVISGTLVEP